MEAKATPPARLVSVAVLLLLSYLARAQDVVGIGGFITVSSSFGSGSVDFSVVRIHLLDPNGVKKSDG